MAPLGDQRATSTEFSTGRPAPPVVARGRIAGDLTVSVSPRSWSVMLMVPVTCGMSCAELSPATLDYRRVRIDRGIDRRHVIGAGDGDDQVLRADIAVAVIDLGNKGDGERVACAQPVEVGGGRVVVPVDGLLLAVGDERIEADGAARRSTPRRRRSSRPARAAAPPGL